MPNKLLNTDLFRTGKVELRKPGRQTWTLMATGDVRPNLESHGVLTASGYPACSVREWLDAFLDETMRKDPYLRCMKDMSRLWNRFPRFDEL